MNFITALILVFTYGVSTALIWRAWRHSLRATEYSRIRWARFILAIGICIHFAWMIAWSRQFHSVFPASTAQTQMELAIIFAMIALLGTWRPSQILVSLILLSLSILTVGLSYFLSTSVDRALPISPWLWTHILLALLGEVFLGVAAAVSIGYLILDRGLRTRRRLASLSRLPALSDFDQHLGRLLVVGFLFLTGGIALGMSFAESYWSEGWLFDPKVLFAVLAWLLYAILITLRALSQIYWGRVSAYLAIVGFAGILFFSWGMQIVVPSQHQLFESAPSGFAP